MPLDDGDRCRSARASALHGDQRLPPRVRGVRRQSARPSSRETDAGANRRGRFSTTSIARSRREFARGSSRPNVLDDERNADASCRAWVRALGGRGLAARVRSGRVRRRARRARRAHAVPRARDARLPLGARRLCVCDAGTWAARRSRSSATRSCSGAICRSVAQRPLHRGVCALRARSGLRRRRDCDDGAPRRRRLRDRRREDVDFQRRHRRPVRRVCADRRRRREGPLGVRGRRDDGGLFGRQAHRDDLAASARLAALRGAAASPLARRIGEEGDGFKIAMATLDVFRSTVGAAALGFARRALAESVEHATTRKLFGAPLAALQLTQAAIADDGHRCRCDRAARLSRRLGEG